MKNLKIKCADKNINRRALVAFDALGARANITANHYSAKYLFFYFGTVSYGSLEHTFSAKKGIEVTIDELEALAAEKSGLKEITGAFANDPESEWMDKEIKKKPEPTLEQKLKDALIAHLIYNPQIVDEPYLFTEKREWTRWEIAKEIDAETEIGIKQMEMMLYLSLDLMAIHGETSSQQRFMAAIKFLENNSEDINTALRIAAGLEPISDPL